ncbi:unnamed protein product, partial [Rotaria sp. Silwood2]
MNEWKRHFEDLLSVKPNASQTTHIIPPADQDLPINIGPITINEVQQAIKQLKNEKSSGLDHIITLEVLKHGGDWVINKLLLVDGQISQEFDVTTGVLQGDTLAPFLFIIVIDYVMKNAESDPTNEQGEHGFITNLRQSQRQPTTTIHDLDFAVGIALLESNFDRAQMQLITTAKWADKVGLQ